MDFGPPSTYPETEAPQTPQEEHALYNDNGDDDGFELNVPDRGSQHSSEEDIDSHEIELFVVQVLLSFATSF